ncbi:hypothetical protein [Aquimarina sp. AU474]|uniref:hypothetical protein n=1 Tax=Aquimarina sp. AU474 TaxID=2108529 RepID=UPI000D6952B5|nr:hypothetical protein [Aquimarina sp. AU474]
MLFEILNGIETKVLDKTAQKSINGGVRGNGCVGDPCSSGKHGQKCGCGAVCYNNVCGYKI